MTIFGVYIKIKGKKNVIGPQVLRIHRLLTLKWRRSLGRRLEGLIIGFFFLFFFAESNKSREPKQS